MLGNPSSCPCSNQTSASGAKYGSRSRTTSLAHNLNDTKQSFVSADEDRKLMPEVGTGTRQSLAIIGKKGTDTEEISLWDPDLQILCKI